MLRSGGLYDWRRATSRVMASLPVVVYCVLAAVFSIVLPAFLSLDNVANILVQSAPFAIAAIGVTFVLLVAGIDLSSGSVMFLAAAAGGMLVVRGEMSAPVSVAAMAVVGMSAGAVNGILVAGGCISPFIVTLATLFVARGAGLWITQTRALNLPDEFRQLAVSRLAGVPQPIVMLALTWIAAHVVLCHTPFGRHLYAIGFDRDAARKAGLRVERCVCLAFLIAGGCAGLAGAIVVAQLAAVSPNLGQGAELEIIAAAVLGGTSLFGGRGTAGGAVLGALFVQTVRNGLNLADADPFIYPMVTGAVVFAAVLIDSIRQHRLATAPRKILRRRGRTSSVDDNIAPTAPP